MAELTQDQRRELLLLSASEWRQLCIQVKQHHVLGGIVPKHYSYLMVFSRQQWHTISSKLNALRLAHKDRLNELRRQARAAASKTKKREYMRQYMRSYRKSHTESGNGQIGNRCSGSSTDRS